MYILVPLEKLYNFGFSRGGPRWPPRHGYGAPLALKQGLIFSKAPLRGAVILLPWVRAKKNLARGRKNGVETGFEPEFLPIFVLIFVRTYLSA